MFEDRCTVCKKRNYEYKVKSYRKPADSVIITEWLDVCKYCFDDLLNDSDLLKFVIYWRRDKWPKKRGQMIDPEEIITLVTKP